MLDNMNNTFRKTVFEISVDVPLTFKTTMHINAFLPTDTANPTPPPTPPPHDFFESAFSRKGVQHSLFVTFNVIAKFH